MLSFQRLILAGSHCAGRCNALKRVGIAILYDGPQKLAVHALIGLGLESALPHGCCQYPGLELRPPICSLQLQRITALQASLINIPKRARKGGVTLVGVIYAANHVLLQLVLHCHLCADASSHSRDCHSAAEGVLALP